MFTRKDNVKANRILGLYLLMNTVSFFHYANLMEGLYTSHTIFLEATWFAYFSFGPFVFLYTRRMLGYDKKWKDDAIHLLPSALIFVITMGIYYFGPADVAQSLYLGESTFEYQKTDKIVLILKSLFSVHYFYYKIWALILIFRYERLLKYAYSRHTVKVIGWLKLLIYVKLTIFLFGIPWYSFVDSQIALNLYPIVHYTIFFVLLMKLISQPKVFEGIRADVLEKDFFKLKLPRSTESFSFQELEQVYEKLESHFMKDKLYRNQNLQIGNLAKQINEPLVKVLLAFEKVGQRQFSDYVSNRRALVVKSMLDNAEFRDNSFEFISYETGYESVEAMNFDFKKYFQFDVDSYRQQVLA